jgi:hypothetical protein
MAGPPARLIDPAMDHTWPAPAAAAGGGESSAKLKDVY